MNKKLSEIHKKLLEIQAFIIECISLNKNGDEDILNSINDKCIELFKLSIKYKDSIDE